MLLGWVGQAWRRGSTFRSLLIGYFEGIDSERGIAWRLADSLALAAVCAHRPDGADAGSLDDFADAAADRRGDASGRYSAGCWDCWRIAGC